MTGQVEEYVAATRLELDLLWLIKVDMARKLSIPRCGY